MKTLITILFTFLISLNVSAQYKVIGYSSAPWGGIDSSWNSHTLDSVSILITNRFSSTGDSLRRTTIKADTAYVWLGALTTGMGLFVTTTQYNSLLNRFVADSAAKSVALLGKVSIIPTITNNVSLTIQTVAAAANGSRISTSYAADVHYSATIVSTASIAGSAVGYLVLEICPTNSVTASDWIEIGRAPNGQAVSLAIVLQSVSTGGCQVSGTVPAGYYRRLRAINTSGTQVFTYNTGQEKLINN